MSKTMNWADDDGSSDEGSVDEQPIARQRKPSEDRSQEPQPKPQPQTTSSAPSGKQYRQQNTKIPDRPPYMAFIANLNYTVTRDMLGCFFVNGGCNVHDVQIHLKDGQPRGTAIVEFSDRESLEKSLGAHDEIFEKRPISVGVSDRTHHKNNRNGRGDGDRYGRDNRGGDRRNDRGDRGGNSRGDARNRNNKNSPRGAPPLPTPSLQPGVVGTASSSTVSSGAPVRKKLEIKPRQAPMDTIGERVVGNSSIFGDGKARDESTPKATTSLNNDVKNLTIDSDKANTDNTETPKTSVTKDSKSGGDDDKKKGGKDHQKNSKDKDTNKKDKNTPRGDKRHDNKDRKGGDKDNNSRKGNTPKSQERRTPTGNGGGEKSKKGKAEKEKESNEASAATRFLAAQEKLHSSKPQGETVAKPKKENKFSALMMDDDDSDSDASS